MKVNGVDVFHPSTGEVRSDGADGIACWFIDTDYNEESFFVRHAYFLGANDPYKALKTTLKAEIDEEAWATLHSDTSRPFDKPRVRPHRGEGHQPPRRRGDEGVPGLTWMEFRIADTFTDSLARLTGDEQKAVKTTAFDLQMNPGSPGMSSTSSTRPRTGASGRCASASDIRLIVHRTAQSLLLCYVDHHDEAYDWAERRKLETHPETGAAQLVEVRETVQEIVVPAYVDGRLQPAPPKPPLFAHVPDDELLGYGVPPEWLDDVRAATEDTLPRARRPPAGRGRRGAARARDRGHARRRAAAVAPRR